MQIKLDEETERRLRSGAVYHGLTPTRLVSILINEHVPIIEYTANGVKITESTGRRVIEVESKHKPLPGQTSFLD